MRLELDENLGARGFQLFAERGHDVATVVEQGLEGASDRVLAEVCGSEGRCLVTLDLDFSNPFIFPPEEYAGIAVLRLPRRPTPRDLERAIHVLLEGSSRETIAGKLWIVERHRIRQHLRENIPESNEDE